MKDRTKSIGSLIDRTVAFQTVLDELAREWESEPSIPPSWLLELADDLLVVAGNLARHAKAAEWRQRGHECGSEFTIRIDDPAVVAYIRAHSLRQALLLATTQPWVAMGDGEHEGGAS